METQPTDREPNGWAARLRVVQAALWVLFGLLVAIGGWLFLRACGTYPLLGLGHDFCPVPADHRALQREIDTGEGLRRQVHAAELQVAEIPPCAPLRPTIEPPRPTIEQQRRIQQNDRRVQDKGGKKGKLQFTLFWHTKDDLDLELYCPGGQISSYAGHRGPGICGDGVKDLDANRNATAAARTDPVENITFSDVIPEGTYTVQVIEYVARDQSRPNKVPFTLQMRWNDQVKICQGDVTWNPRSLAQRDAQGLIGGTYQTIQLTYGENLPDCAFTPQSGHLDGPAK